MTSTFLSAFYDIGDKIGHFSAYAIIILMALVWIFIMFKYLDSSDLND